MVATRKYTQVWRTGDHDYSTEGGDWMKTNAKGTTISRDQKNAAWSLHSESVQPGTGSFTFKMGASCMRTTLQILSPFFFSSASNNVTCTFFCSRRCDAVENTIWKTEVWNWLRKRGAELWSSGTALQTTSSRSAIVTTLPISVCTERARVMRLIEPPQAHRSLAILGIH